MISEVAVWMTWEMWLVVVLLLLALTAAVIYVDWKSGGPGTG